MGIIQKIAAEAGFNMQKYNDNHGPDGKFTSGGGGDSQPLDEKDKGKLTGSNYVNRQFVTSQTGAGPTTVTHLDVYHTTGESGNKETVVIPGSPSSKMQNPYKLSGHVAPEEVLSRFKAK